MMHEFIKRCKRGAHLFPVFGHPIDRVQDPAKTVTDSARPFSLYLVTFLSGVSPKTVTYGHRFPVFGHPASPYSVTFAMLIPCIQSPSYP
jgi:hypothetical protein